MLTLHTVYKEFAHTISIGYCVIITIQLPNNIYHFHAYLFSYKIQKILMVIKTKFKLN